MNIYPSSIYLSKCRHESLCVYIAYRIEWYEVLTSHHAMDEFWFAKFSKCILKHVVWEYNFGAVCHESLYI